MVCIYCQGKTRVTNSRPQKRTNAIWRRRQCTDCGAVFTTSEAPDLLKSVLVVRHKRVEPFSRDLLFLSIHDSLKHRKTAVSDATGLTDTVLGKLLPHINAASLTREQIVQTTQEVLKRFDKAAAMSYAAFHPLDV